MKLPRPFTALVTSVALTTGLVVAAPTASAQAFTWVNKDGETCTMDHILTDEEEAYYRQKDAEFNQEFDRELALATTTVDFLNLHRKLYLDAVDLSKRYGCPVESQKTKYISRLRELASSTDRDDEVGLLAIRSELITLGVPFTKAKELTLTAKEFQRQWDAKHKKKITPIKTIKTEEEDTEAGSSALLSIFLPIVGSIALVALVYGISAGQMVNHIKANPSLYPNSPLVKK